LVQQLPRLPVDSPILRILSCGPNFRAAWPEASLSHQEGSENRLTEIKLKKGEPIEKALRRLKKKIDREGTLKVVRATRHYEKPSERRRRKEKAARFSAMLSARYADM
jgi:small subunit ribosomal protein S21